MAVSWAPYFSQTQHIANLPKRQYTGENLPDDLERPEADIIARGHVPLRLRPVQRMALEAIKDMRGGFLPIGVGHGKTLITMLAPRVLQAKRPLLLLPPRLIQQWIHDLHRYNIHFKVWTNDNRMQILPYTALSGNKNSDKLDYLEPDLIIADEAHCLKRRSSARTRRLIRYFENKPDTMFVALSGTMSARSVNDFVHLAAMALKKDSFVPFEGGDLAHWMVCLDPDTRVLVSDTSFAHFEPILERAGIKERPDKSDDRRALCRDAFRALMDTAPGVIGTHDPSAQCSLNLFYDATKLPDPVIEAMRRIEAGWMPDGNEEIDTPLLVPQYLQQVSCGFYYRFVWPEGVKDEDWLAARRRWGRFIQRELEERSAVHYDSPWNIQNAVIRKCEEYEKKGLDPSRKDAGCAAWLAWKRQKEKPAPPREIVWLSDFLVDYIKDFISKSDDPVIVWYHFDALADRLREIMPVYSAGVIPPEDVAHHCAMSISAHHQGRNLQAWHENLIVHPPESGLVWEQLLGRTHRQGQLADEVNATVLLHTDVMFEAFAKAKTKAHYLQATYGNQQKLCYAQVVEPLEDIELRLKGQQS